MSEERKVLDNPEGGASQVSIVNVQLPKRYVIYSPSWGVFLGGDGSLWSKKDRSLITPDRQAPTFGTFDEFKRASTKPYPSDAKGVEILPTSPDKTVSADEVATRLLPPWNV